MTPKRKTQKAKAPTSKKKSRTQSKSTDVYVASQTAPAISSVNQVNVLPPIEVTGMPMALTSSAMATGTPSATTQQGFPIIEQLRGEHYQDPIPIPTYAEQDIFVNDGIKNKIWNGEYIDLALLLRPNFCQSATNTSSTLTVVDNQLTIKQSGTKIKVPINSIQNWTDAFINFIIVFSLQHGDKVVELLIYMTIIRGAAMNNPIHKWLEYDTQFRLRMSKDPSKNWATIDGHLWLSCGLFGDLSAVTQYAAPCYEYNFKGVCSRPNCAYAHTCMKCRVTHPACTCNLYLESKQSSNSSRYNAGQSTSYQTLGFGFNRPSSMPRPFQPAATSSMYTPRQRMNRPQATRSPGYISQRPIFRTQARFVGTRAYPN